jgi:hypothetical protein
MPIQPPAVPAKELLVGIGPGNALESQRSPCLARRLECFFDRRPSEQQFGRDLRVTLSQKGGAAISPTVRGKNPTARTELGNGAKG